MTQLNHQPDLRRGSEILPTGKYTVVFEDCKERTSIYGEDYFTFVWCIVEGEYAGRKILDHIYYYASDPEYREKALLKLDRICQIFAIDYLDNTSLLWQRKCQVQTGHRLNSQGQACPYVKGYWPLEETQAES